MNKIIKGIKVDFRQIRKEDLVILRDWRNAKGIREYNTQFTLLNMINQKKWFEQLCNKNSDRVMFMVTNKTKKPIGVCGFIHLNKIDHCADVAIIIGEQNVHGRGIGSEVLYMLTKYGFDHLGLHRIGAEIFSYNTISIQLFKKLSFKREVTLRESLWRDGKWWDVYVFSLLKSEQKIWH